MREKQNPQHHIIAAHSPPTYTGYSSANSPDQAWNSPPIYAAARNLIILKQHSSRLPQWAEAQKQGTSPAGLNPGPNSLLLQASDYLWALQLPTGSHLSKDFLGLHKYSDCSFVCPPHCDSRTLYRAGGKNQKSSLWYTEQTKVINGLTKFTYHPIPKLAGYYTSISGFCTLLCIVSLCGGGYFGRDGAFFPHVSGSCKEISSTVVASPNSASKLLRLSYSTYQVRSTSIC